ncbi:MAG: aldose epimerase family protein [Bacteroidota bacterium]
MTEQKIWGHMPDGRPVSHLTLALSDGVSATFANLGAIWISMLVPDQQGQSGDVVLGFDTLEEYLQPHPFIGAVIGRVGNRIAHGRFSIDEQAYQLAQNLPPHNLHGGPDGFGKQLWEVGRLTDGPEPSVEFTLVSPDGYQGFPGEVRVLVRYTLTRDHAIRIEYEATTDAPTLVNLTHHAYFNLEGQGDIKGHLLQLDADEITENDATSVPTGAFMPVAGTPFDFNVAAPVGERLAMEHPQLTVGNGFDHNFVIRGWDRSLRRFAEVVAPVSGRRMTVETTEPGVQLYTANFLDNLTGKGGQTYTPNCSLCLETQNYPDAVNHPHFPSPVLRPGETYRQTTVYRFG